MRRFSADTISGRLTRSVSRMTHKKNVFNVVASILSSRRDNAAREAYKRWAWQVKDSY